jgi:predicted transcriptional regulator
MKKIERDAARRMRSEGHSIKAIASALQVSKASVSTWVRDIELTQEQRNRLSQNGRSVDAIERRRATRIAATQERHRTIIDEAKLDIKNLTKRELFLIGIALYWGEGNKKGKKVLGLANCDPLLIRIIMRFFREICDVPEEKFRGHIHTFSHLNAQEAEEYWSSISGIPRTQFFKTYSKPSRATTGKKDSQPYGTFQVYVSDTILFLKVQGWIEALAESTEPV